MIRRAALGAFLAAAAIAAAGCGGSGNQPTDVVIVTHDSFAISPEVKRAFEEESGLKLKILKAGDAGEVVTRALLTAGNPEGDVLFGFDNNLLARVLAGDVFEPYEPPELASVDPALVLDPEHRATPIDRGDVCLNYDKGWYESRGIAPPRTPRRPRAPPLPRSARRREPGDVDARARVHARDDRRVRGRVEGLLEQAPCERRPRRRRLGGRLLLTLLGFGGKQGQSAGGRLVRVEPTRRGHLREAPAEHRSDRRRRGELLPPDRVRGRAARREERGGRTGSSSTSCSRSGSRRTSRCRCSCSRRGRDAALPPEFERFAVVPAHPLELPPAEIDQNRESWVDTWTDTVVR